MGEEIEEKNNDWEQDLRRERAQTANTTTDVASSEEIEKLEKLAGNKKKIVTFILTPIIAGGNAILNYVVIGAVPILGDVIDFGAGIGISAFLFTLEGHPRWKAQILVWALTVVELIPVADIVSPQAIGTGLALFLAWRAGTKAEEQLTEIRAE